MRLAGDSHDEAPVRSGRSSEPRPVSLDMDVELLVSPRDDPRDWRSLLTSPRLVPLDMNVELLVSPRDDPRDWPFTPEMVGM